MAFNMDGYVDVAERILPAILQKSTHSNRRTRIVTGKDRKSTR